MKTSIRKAIAERFKNWKGTSAAKGADIEKSRTSDMPEDVKDSLEVKEQTSVDKATETDTQLCNKNSEDLQPICKNSEKVQQTSVKADEQEPNTPESPSPAEIELCFDSDATDEQEKPLPKATQQRQAIVASIVGTALLVASVAFYALKIHVTVVVVAGIVGLVCIGCALYNTLNPNTKLEKVEKIEQLDLPSPSL
ncbi:hypothetical protein [Wolbachia endosymbiont of Cantharis cryptica]|uniref:hypothetical protein n=1 Tax=Wolbachia endosymbiont of Cantharis cryptica TaxID=3066132 RepID=UPI00376F1D5D